MENIISFFSELLSHIQIEVDMPLLVVPIGATLKRPFKWIRKGCKAAMERFRKPRKSAKNQEPRRGRHAKSRSRHSK